MTDVSSEPYQDIFIFTVYVDIFFIVPTKCQSHKKSSASELPIPMGTGIVVPATRDIHRRTRKPGSSVSSSSSSVWLVEKGSASPPGLLFKDRSSYCLFLDCLAPFFYSF